MQSCKHITSLLVKRLLVPNAPVHFRNVNKTISSLRAGAPTFMIDRGITIYKCSFTYHYVTLEDA